MVLWTRVSITSEVRYVVVSGAPGRKLQFSSHVPSKHPKKEGKKSLVVGNTSFFKDAPKMCPEAKVIFILKTLI